jgi:hypothetical protein
MGGSIRKTSRLLITLRISSLLRLEGPFLGEVKNGALIEGFFEPFKRASSRSSLPPPERRLDLSEGKGAMERRYAFEGKALQAALRGRLRKAIGAVF